MLHKSLRLFSVVGFVLFVACRSETSSKSFNSPIPNTKDVTEVAETEALFEFPQASCGDDIPVDTETWWRVYIDGGNVEDIRDQYCNDAFSTTRTETGIETVQVASFRDHERAEAFARAVGGSVSRYTNLVSIQNTSNPESEKVRFEYKRRIRIDPGDGSGVWGLGLHGDEITTYPPLKTNCDSSEIEDYLVKSISGGADASPFNDEFGALLACGSEAVPYLLQTLSTGNDHSRFNATIALGEMGAVANDEVVPALINTITIDANPLIRVQAIEAIELISPPTSEVVAALSNAQYDSEIVPGSDLNPRGELLPVSEFASEALRRMGRVDSLPSNFRLGDVVPEPREPESRDASCPIKYVWWEGFNTEYRAYYRLDTESGQCVIEGTDRPPATGGDYIIKSFCELFNCRKD